MDKPRLTDTSRADVSRTRIYYKDGTVEHFDDPTVACDVYLSLAKGHRAAFRNAGDSTPVYSHDYVDAL